MYGFDARGSHPADWPEEHMHFPQTSTLQRREAEIAEMEMAAVARRMKGNQLQPLDWIPSPKAQERMHQPASYNPRPHKIASRPAYNPGFVNDGEENACDSPPYAPSLAPVLYTSPDPNVHWVLGWMDYRRVCKGLRMIDLIQDVDGLEFLYYVNIDQQASETFVSALQWLHMHHETHSEHRQFKLRAAYNREAIKSALESRRSLLKSAAFAALAGFNAIATASFSWIWNTYFPSDSECTCKIEA